jgi:hypothetical protein
LAASLGGREPPECAIARQIRAGDFNQTKYPKNHSPQFAGSRQIVMFRAEAALFYHVGIAVSKNLTGQH